MAIPSDRVPAVWARGFDGSNGGANRIGIAVLETGRIDFNGTYLIEGESRDTCGGAVLNDHKTEVAHVAGSYHATYKGVAPGAAIYDACYAGTLSDAASTLQWATNRVDIINQWC